MHCGNETEEGFRKYSEQRTTYLDKICINLEKGGSIVQTKIGNIQYGIPPETVKDSLKHSISVPEYYIIPSMRFDWKKGMNLMEFEFPVYYNFFIRKQTKTKLICDPDLQEDIKKIFQETLLGPKEFPNFEQEFVKDYKGIPNFKKELSYFAKNPFKPKSPLTPELFIDFLVYDSQKEVLITKKVENQKITIKIKKLQDQIQIIQNGELLYSLNQEIQVNDEKFSIYKTISKPGITSLQNFTAPTFGFTMLGSSHGFDACGSTSGFILWVNKKGIMIDPPPFTSKALRKEGVPPNLIEKIIISHCHADHDSGAFHKIIEASPIEFISTPTIMNSFLRKYSAISKISVSELDKLFQYRTVKVGHPTYICGARFLFSYAFHSIPSLRFEVELEGKKFFFSSDTFYDKDKLFQLQKEGVFSEARRQDLADIDFDQYDCILHEAGIPPIHTPIFTLQKLSEKAKKNMYLYHIAEKDIPKGLKGAPLGLEGTVFIIKEPRQDQQFLENLELICSLELLNWVPLKRITEILGSLKEVKHKKGEVILKEGEIGDKFYIIKSGCVQIFSSNLDFFKFCYRGDYFGESAIVSEGVRLANVRAFTDCVLLEMEKNDFLWVFEYQERKSNMFKMTPLKMIQNLSNMRKEKSSEFISDYNQTIQKMTENQKCFLNSILVKIEVYEDQYLWKKGWETQFCFFVDTAQIEMIAPKSKVPKDFIVSEGSLIGDFPNLLLKKSSKSTIKCLKQGTILVLSKEKLKEFLLQYPGVFLILKDCYIIKQFIYLLK